MLIKGIDDVLHFGVLLSIAVRWAVSRFPYSGAGKSPMYGDYEAQRHWMEITVNLPMHEWYENSTNNDLQYWGLDYPPLTAYHSLLCGYVAKWINPDWVKLFSSRGYESYYHKIFMRSTVLVSDVIFYVAVILYWMIIERPYKLRDKAIAASLCLLYPGLILIDHGHFQYNSVCLGLTLLAIVCLLRKNDLVGAIFFTLALHYKQMALYYALPFFCYLFGTCLQLPKREGITKFLLLDIIVVITSSICWLPFLTSFASFSQVVHRLFPLARGIFEDKVANMWYMLSILIKLKNISSASTLVTVSAICTFFAVVPSSLHLLRNPTLYKFRIALVNSSLAFFLFSYQVHEKSILFPVLPVLLLLEDHPLVCIWFSCISTYSLVPLLAKDGLIIPFVALTLLFLVGALRAYEELLLPLKMKHKKIIGFLFCMSLISSLILTISMFTIKQPNRYPHLHVLLNCVYSALHFIGFFIYFNTLQFMSSPLILCSPKLKLT